MPPPDQHRRGTKAMTQKEQRRAQVRAELVRAGALIETLRGHCTRVHGAWGNTILVNDLCDLTKKELHRLTAGAIPRTVGSHS